MGVSEATPGLKWQVRAAGPAQNVPPRPPHHSGQGQPSWALDESRHPRTRCSRNTGSSPGCFLELISWSSPLQHGIDGAAAAAGAPRCCQPGHGAVLGREIRVDPAVPRISARRWTPGKPGRLNRGLAVRDWMRAVFSKPDSQQRAAPLLSLSATCAGTPAALFPLFLISAAHP